MTVLLPLMLPGLLAGWILVFASTSASFVTQASSAAPAMSTCLSSSIAKSASLFDWPFASAIAVVLLLTTGAFLFALTTLSRHRRLVSHA